MTSNPFCQAAVRVLANVQLARDTYRLRLLCPEMARLFRPGQFLMLRVPGRTDPLLGRAFALYETDGQWLDIVYLVMGKMTRLMATLQAKDHATIWGPLGNGFPDYAGIDHLILVAGGIGQTPFPALIRRALGKRGYQGSGLRREVESITLYYGARTHELLAGLDDFSDAGAEVRLATDDGSRGFRGFVTQLLDQDLQSGLPKRRVHVVGCGPEPMLNALAELAARRGLPCDLSLETPMACGVGICFSCVTRVRTPTGWDYRRTCVDGPIFRATELVPP